VGRVIVYNCGTYDLLHPGHLYVFRQLRRLAGPDGRVVVGLNPDSFVEQFKGHPPVQSYDERFTMLTAIRDIDVVVENTGGADARPTIEAVGPDIIAAGHDWYSDDDSRYCRQMGFSKAWLAEHGIELVYLDWMAGYSSTNLRATARAMER
jgi:cytidyltransferase-like protein